MSWLSRLGEIIGVQHRYFDWATIADSDPFAAEHALIKNIVAEMIKLGSLPRTNYNLDLSKLDSSKTFLAGDRDQQARCVHCLVLWLSAADQKARQFRSSATDRNNPHLESGWREIWKTRQLLYAILSKLLTRKLPLSRETLSLMLDWFLAEDWTYSRTGIYPFSTLLTLAEELAKSSDGLGDLAGKFHELAERLVRSRPDPLTRKVVERIHSLVGLAPEIPITPGEAWANAALADLANLEGSDRDAWAGLLHHCKTANGGTPNARWLKDARSHLDRLKQGQVADFLSRWLSLTDKKREQSALSPQAWIIRCAVGKYYTLRNELYLSLARGGEGWKDLELIEKAITESENPWEYLRDFANRAEVRKLFGNSAPSIDLPTSPPVFAPIEDLLIDPAHMDLLVGLAWVSGLQSAPGVTRSLGLLAVSAYRKLPGIGPRAVRVGNSSITALGMIGDEDALGQLALLKVKVKFGGAQIAIDKALSKLAAKLEVSRDDLVEMSVPTYGMTGVGCLSQPIGEFTAVLTVINSRQTQLAWFRADGKSQKALPAALKQEFADEVKELMAAKKDIEKMLPAQAERLDGLYLRRKSWPLSVWRERYLDHPLVGALARRLLWNFTSCGITSSGLWLKDQLVNRLGNPLVMDEADTKVSLWHPLDQDSSSVLGWRGFLEEWEIVQPFKQAHREIYLLTPAEERTEVYSNRIAAHLLRQHQFNSLCAARGWKNKLRLMVDDTYPPATRFLPEWGLRAEYWIEGVGTGGGEDVLDSGAYRYVATDQIRFYQEDSVQLMSHGYGGGYDRGWQNQPSSEPIPLAQVDPLVFSEIMRDADLFVGVGSVGNDPTWLDGGRNEQQHDYWGSYSFGELNASAQTRKTLLERLVPKLKIAGACSFEEKFLIVQGKRHSYKIHLGSGNILIMPQDKYLCIVPAQGQVDKAGETIFLPFEGDRTLSLILSKAFLLAADDEIKDPTILLQLS